MKKTKGGTTHDDISKKNEIGASDLISANFDLDSNTVLPLLKEFSNISSSVTNHPVISDIPRKTKKVLPPLIFNLDHKEDLPRDVKFRIEDCKTHRKPSLDLSGFELQTVPEDVFDLDHLTSLDLSDNSLKSIPAKIEALCILVDLRISDNNLTKIPQTIGKLTRLERLDLDNNNLSSLPKCFSNLSTLSWLDLGYNIFDKVPEVLNSLPQLHLLGMAHTQIKENSDFSHISSLILLDIGGNQLDEIPSSIFNLPDLASLYLNKNKIVTIPGDIGNLTELKFLTLQDNLLSDLPLALRKLPRLEFLYLHNNEKLNLPIEILGSEFHSMKDKFSPKARDILQFYFSRKSGRQRALNEVKVLVVGEGSVGKTSLIRQLRKQKYNPVEDKTHGIERYKVPIKCGKIGYVQLNIWDFGGQDIMHATHQFFMTHRSIYLLVVDSRQNERQTRIDYWLRLIASYGGDSPVIVVCNKSDQQTMQLNWTALQRDYPQIKAYIKEFSCSEGSGLSELDSAIASAVVHHLPEINKKIPATWEKVKNELESDGRDYLTLEDYNKLAMAKGIKDPIDRKLLLSLLHHLGSVLHLANIRFLTAIKKWMQPRLMWKN